MQTIQLVKYLNRKIYNYELSRYLNVTDVKDFIDAGYNVVVSEHKTNVDVTRQVVGEVIKQCEGDLTNVYLFMLKRGVK
jgi:polyhydroxyalkanoate synthesis regulator protein